MRFVEVSDLKEGMILDRDILNSGKTFILKRGTELNDIYIGHLKEKGYIGAYIRDKDFSDVELKSVITDSTRDMCIEAVENMDLERIMNAAEQMVAEISKLNSLSLDMVDLRCYDDYTYHHSVNVSVFSVAIGRAMGMTDDQLIKLCQAGLCHDLGKQKIPIEILNKPGRLSPEELKEVKNHPQYSYDILQDNLEISSEVRQSVLSHHENENGSGYPRGLGGDQLSLAAKILHAADVYDALISKRPYKKPYSPADAMEYLLGGKNILFNSKVVDAMISIIPAYPTATEVILSTGEHAVIIRQTNVPTRPIVRTIPSKTFLNLALPENKDIAIVASGMLEPGYSREVDKLNETNTTLREGPPKIMLVDDSLIALQQTSKSLEEENYEIIALQSGIAAINYIKKNGAPDLIIMDIDMPTLDGITVTEKIQQMGYTDLPVIFLTAMDDRKTVMRCIMVHAKDYIVKPVRPAYLKGRIARALNEGLER